MDPFGDDNAVEEGVSQEIGDFVPSRVAIGDFYEVEPVETETTDTYENQMEASQTFEASHHQMEESSGYSFEQYGEGPVHAPTSMESSGHIPFIEEENELTVFMREYEQKIALKAQEQEQVAVECKAKAEEGMAQFVAERQRIKEAKMQANRVVEQAALEKMAADLESENPWERVVTLVDLEMNRKKKLEALDTKKDSKEQDPKLVAVPAKKTSVDEEDVSRMRQMFVQLKTAPLEQTRASAVAAN
uniref:Clathrin light chain n=1 Tax=Peronospora matthiolae TaxID=2874970 RepID=A0AAV1UL47_9STRA